MPSTKQPATSGPLIRAYLAKLPPDARKFAKQLRGVIKASAPDAVEAFSYGIPGFKLNGKSLIWYAGWKQHASLYPIGAAIKRSHAADIDRYETSKGTIRFPLDEPVPTALVKRLVRARIGEVKRGERVNP